MNTSHFRLLVATLALTVAFLHSNAKAAPTDLASFREFAIGRYLPTQPALERFFGKFRIPSLGIYMNKGTMYLGNDLYVGSKNTSGRYEITGFDCYDLTPDQTECRLNLRMVDAGVYVHFLGLNPKAQLTRRGDSMTLDVDTNYSVVDRVRSEHVIAERSQIPVGEFEAKGIACVKPETGTQESANEAAELSAVNQAKERCGSLSVIRTTKNFRVTPYLGCPENGIGAIAVSIFRCYIPSSN